MRDRIRGVFLGVGIGDALGMPVETFSPKKILEKYPETKGRIDKYIVPTGHKWFDGSPAGSWTDDTELTVATAEAMLLTGDPLDMDSQAQKHIESMNESGGKSYGGTTRKAVQNLKDGISWKTSGLFGDKTGTGNGVCMKVAPIAVYATLTDLGKDIVPFIVNYSAMTHRTVMGVQSGYAHTLFLIHCLSIDKNRFKEEEIVTQLIGICSEVRGYLEKDYRFEYGDSKDDLADQFKKLLNYQNMTPEQASQEFGKGHCYVYYSLPFSYYYFLRNPFSIESLYDVASQGGDSDSNASMVASLLGALNGADIFPQHLIWGLDQHDRIISLADRFYDTFFGSQAKQ